MKTLLLLSLLAARPNWVKVDFRLYLNKDSVKVQGTKRTFEYADNNKIRSATVDCLPWTFDGETIYPDTFQDYLAAEVCK